MPTSSFAVTVRSVTLQGVSSGPAEQRERRGQWLGRRSEWISAARQNYTSTFPMERAWLHEGTNTITLTALNGENDIQPGAIHHAGVSAHATRRIPSWLQATAPAGVQSDDHGFANSQNQVYDITNPLEYCSARGFREYGYLRVGHHASPCRVRRVRRNTRCLRSQLIRFRLLLRSLIIRPALCSSSDRARNRSSSRIRILRRAQHRS